MVIDDVQIVASRGRNPENPADRTPGMKTEQRLEPNNEGTSFCLTTIAKDNWLMSSKQYRIRKLTARECWRLMSFKDEDYEKAANVNSKTQLYKEAGNSIVRNVLMALFSQMNIQGIKPWNKMSEKEREELCTN